MLFIGCRFRWIIKVCLNCYDKKILLFEFKICLFLRWILRGKIGFLFVVILILSLFDDMFNMWLVVWENWGLVDDILFVKNKGM